MKEKVFLDPDDNEIVSVLLDESQYHAKVIKISSLRVGVYNWSHPIEDFEYDFDGWIEIPYYNTPLGRILLGLEE